MEFAKKSVGKIAWSKYEPHENVLIKTLFENDFHSQIYANVKPNGRTIAHYHSGSELFFVPPKTLHQVENNSEEDLLIISTFQPAFSKQKHSWQEK